MTEDQIEREVERQFDRLDARLMAGKLSQVEYDRKSRAIDEWASSQYAKAAAWVIENIPRAERTLTVDGYVARVRDMTRPLSPETVWGYYTAKEVADGLASSALEAARRSVR